MKQHRHTKADHQLIQEFNDEINDLDPRQQVKRVRQLLANCRLTRAYEEFSDEFDREEARLAAQGAPNQCP
jgi:hypothetical protein